MNWLKLLTKSGRQGVVRDLLKEYITPEAAARYGAQGVNTLLGKINDKEKLGAVALNLEQGAALVEDVSAAIKDGEVTPKEAEAITVRTQFILGRIVDQAKIYAFIEYVVSKVP